MSANGGAPVDLGGRSMVFLDPEFSIFDCGACCESFQASWEGLEPGKAGDSLEPWIDGLLKGHETTNPACHKNLAASTRGLQAGVRLFTQLIG